MTQYSLRKKEKRNLYYVLQCNSVRTTIPELCGMCPLTASDWNLHSLNNCSTQSVVVYCHSESKSSADHNTGSTQREKRDQSSVAVLKARQSVHYWCKGIKTAYAQIFADIGYKYEKTLFKNACVRIIFLSFTQHQTSRYTLLQVVCNLGYCFCTPEYFKCLSFGGFEPHKQILSYPS